MTRILIADDHAIVRVGLQQTLAKLYISTRVEEVTSFDSVLAKIDEHPFDLLILDINLPGGNSLQMLDVLKLRQPNIKVLIFSGYAAQLYALDYLKAGADGYIEKHVEEQEVKHAIETVLNGEKYFDAKTRQLLLKHADDPKKTSNNPFDQLSSREIEVMNLLSKGYPLIKIAEMLHIQVTTVSTYKSRIFEKLNISNIVELVEKMRLYLP